MMVSSSCVSSLILAPPLAEQLARITLGVITTARLEVVILFTELFSDTECRNRVRNCRGRGKLHGLRVLPANTVRACGKYTVQ